MWETRQLHEALSDHYITVSPTGNIIATTVANHVDVYSDQGKYLYQIPRPGDETKLVDPRGVCTDSQGNLYVADRERKVVCVFDVDGKYVRDAVTGLDVNHWWVSWLDIALYDDRLLAVGVTSFIGRSISLYALQ